MVYGSMVAQDGIALVERARERSAGRLRRAVERSIVVRALGGVGAIDRAVGELWRRRRRRRELRLRFALSLRRIGLSRTMPLLGLLPAATAALIANAPTRDRMPFGLLTIQPTFTVSDWNVATRVLDDFLGLARKEKGCSYCGYTRSLTGDKLFISEAFNSAESVVEHVQAYKTIKPALSGAVSLERMQLHGPADEIEKCMSAMPAGTQCFPMRAKPSGFSFFSKQTGGLMTAQTLCSLKPMLLISDWEKAEKIMADYVERAALEPGLIYCGWTSDEDSTRAFLRVAH